MAFSTHVSDTHNSGLGFLDVAERRGHKRPADSLRVADQKPLAKLGLRLGLSALGRSVGLSNTLMVFNQIR